MQRKKIKRKRQRNAKKKEQLKGSRRKHKLTTGSDKMNYTPPPLSHPMNTSNATHGASWCCLIDFNLQHIEKCRTERIM